MALDEQFWDDFYKEIGVTGGDSDTSSPGFLDTLGNFLQDPSFKDFNSILDSVGGLATGLTQVGQKYQDTVIPLQTFQKIGDNLKASLSNYETQLATLDQLRDTLGVESVNQYGNYGETRKGIQSKIDDYQKLLQSIQDSNGQYKSMSSADFLGAVANYSPTTKAELTSMLGTYDPVTAQAMRDSMGEYDPTRKADMSETLGAYDFFDPSQLQGRADQIAVGKRQELDRMLDRVNSAGYANNIRNGVDRSSLESLRKEQVAEKFAPEYSKIGTDSYASALSQATQEYQNYLSGRQGYVSEQSNMDAIERAGRNQMTNEATALDSLERAGRSQLMNEAQTADSIERAGLGFGQSARTAADQASQLSRLQGYKEADAANANMLTAQGQQAARDMTAWNNLLNGYATTTRQLGNMASDRLKTSEEAYGKAYATYMDKLKNDVQAAAAAKAGSSGSSGGSSSGGFLGTLGKVAGTAGTIAKLASVFGLSSKEYKEGKEPIDKHEVLESLRGLPIEEWEYKSGIEDEGADRHIGPYAEDFSSAFGGPSDRINMVDAFGISAASIQALADRLDELEMKLDKQSGPARLGQQRPATLGGQRRR